MRTTGSSTPSASVFLTTRWSVVLAAAQGSTTEARAALDKLCKTYWYPLYAYIRRRGYGAADAEDLTQGYFARLLGLNSLAAVRREKGRFRSFLLAGVNHFLADERDRAVAQKRDVRRTISLEAESAEHRYRLEPLNAETPEHLYERQWAITLLETVVQRLHGEYDVAGKGLLFMALRFAITGDRHGIHYADLAAQLSMSEAAVRVAVHRLRRRYRKLLREEIANTVANDAEIEEELRYLRRILSSQ